MKTSLHPAPAGGGRPCPTRRAFSLIEICAVMAILAILAAALVPSLMRQMDTAARIKEAKDLSALADGLQASILRNQQVPDAAGWAAMVAEELAHAANNVATNQRRFARAYLINPNLSLARPGATGLPYVQGTNGVARPVNATLMLVGSTRGVLPLSSGTPTAAEYAALWNTPQGQKPTTSLWDDYTSSGEDLLVQRVNLEPLFCRLILTNPTTNTPPRFSIDTSSPITLTTNLTPWIRYYLTGTTFGLFDTNANLVGREVLQADTYRVFDGTAWRDSLLQGATAASGGTRTLQDLFINSPAPTPNPKWYGTPRGVASIFQSFMYSYSSWANQNPCFSYGGAGNNGFAAENTLITSALGTEAKAGILVE